MRSVILVNFLLLAQLGFSQINLKVGYSLDYVTSSSNNRILNDYNAKNTWLSEEFTNVRFYNGFQIGLRYRIENIGLDLQWERLKNEKTASGISPSDENINSTLNYNFNRYAIGLETYLGFAGIGANINYETFSLKSPIANTDQKILREGNFGNKIYLLFTSKGSNTVAVSFQPYIQIPWSSIRLNKLNTYLDSPTPNTVDLRQAHFHYGFSIIFYNGPQSN